MIKKDKMLLRLFIERAELRQKIKETKQLLNDVINRHHTMGAPLNDNCLKFNNKQLHYLKINLDDIKYSLNILEGEK